MKERKRERKKGEWGGQRKREMDEGRGEGRRKRGSKE